MNTITRTTDVKARLSEFLGRVRHGGERIIISRRGKPIAAIISMDDLRRLEHAERSESPATLTEKDGILVLSATPEKPLDEVVNLNRERRDSQLLKQTGL